GWRLGDREAVQPGTQRVPCAGARRAAASGASRAHPEWAGAHRLRGPAAGVVAGIPALVQRAWPDLLPREIRADDPGGGWLLDRTERPGQRWVPRAPGGDESRRAALHIQGDPEGCRGPRAGSLAGAAPARLAVCRVERCVQDPGGVPGPPAGGALLR